MVARAYGWGEGMSIKGYREGVFFTVVDGNYVSLLKWLLESMLKFFELYFYSFDCMTKVKQMNKL